MKCILLRRLLLLAWLICPLFAATPQDTLIIAVENEAPRINPLFNEDHDAVTAMVFSGLVRFDANLKPSPDLASSWSISLDGLIYEFELRRGVKWHDGKPFGAQDVAFTLQAIQNPKLNSPLKVNFDAIKEVKVLSDYKIRITLKHPFPAFLDAMSLGILPRHLLEGQDLNTTAFNASPIGTGAYRFIEWKKGQYVRLKANEHFHLGKVQTLNLILKSISDPSIASLELKNGSLDAALVDFQLASSFASDPRFHLEVFPSADYRALLFNLQTPLFQDPQVRIALNYAIDREAMLQSLLHSYGFVAQHPLQLSWAAPKTFPSFSYDPQKALQILEKAGWKKNTKGLLEKNGKPFYFEIYAMSHDPLRVSLSTVIQSDLAKIGIQSKVVAKPSGTFDYTKTDSFLVGWGSPFDPDLHTYRVFSSNADPINDPEGWNFGHYANKQVDAALQEARSTQNPKKRKASYARFIQALHEDPPYIFLLYLRFPLVYVSNLTGIEPTTLGHHGVGFTWNVWQWRKN